MRVIPDVTCPICYAEETLRARLGAYEPERYGATMHWCRPHGGPRGQQVTPWDGGWWECQSCGVRLNDQQACYALDAALTAAGVAPGGDEGMHIEAAQALAGGRRVKP